MAFRPEKCLIPEILIERRMTARELAELTGMSETQISDYVHLRKLTSITTARIIADVLQVPIDDLYKWPVFILSKRGRRITE